MQDDDEIRMDAGQSHEDPDGRSWSEDDPSEYPGGDGFDHRGDDTASDAARPAGLVRRVISRFRRDAGGNGSAAKGPARDADPDKADIRLVKTRVRKEKPQLASGNPPITVVLGYIPDTSRKDALQHAKGYAEDHLDAIENAWVALSAFRNGFLFELHEGGDGKSYLPEIIENLNTDPDMIVWVPSGSKLNRVLTVEMIDGLPYATILTEEESAAVRNSGQQSLQRRGRMERLIKKGERMLVAGASLAGVSTAVLLGSVWYGIGINQQPVSLRSYNPDILPHGQIVSLSSALREDRWVSSIKFEEGQWSAEFEEVEEITLPDSSTEAQQMSDELMDIETGVRERLSGNPDADIPELTQRARPEPEEGSWDPAPAGSAGPGGAMPAEDIETFLAEITNDPETFTRRLEDPDFRRSVIETPRLRLAAFRNEDMRRVLLNRARPGNQEE